MRRAFRILEAEAGYGTDPHLTPVFIDVFRRCAAEQPEEFARRYSHLASAADAEPEAGRRTADAGAALSPASETEEPVR